jgi:hypothetical protein
MRVHQPQLANRSPLHRLHVKRRHGSQPDRPLKARLSAGVLWDARVLIGRTGRVGIRLRIFHVLRTNSHRTFGARV